MPFTFGEQHGECEQCGESGWLDYWPLLGIKLCQYCYDTEEQIEVLSMDPDTYGREPFETVSFDDLDEDIVGDVLR